MEDRGKQDASFSKRGKIQEEERNKRDMQSVYEYHFERMNKDQIAEYKMLQCREQRRMDDVSVLP